MRFITKILPLLAVLVSMSAVAQEKLVDDIMVTPVEHATFLIQSRGITVYVDPVGDAGGFARFPKPDIILITHLHHDHFDPGLIKFLKADGTLVVGPKTVIVQLGYGTPLDNGGETTAKGIRIEAVPAYNTTPDRKEFHPQGRDNGYVLNLEGKRIYISGDTEDTREMRQLRNIDTAFICINLPYTMSVEQAASAILEMKPRKVVPYHYRAKGEMTDLQEFKRLVGKNKDIEILLLDWYGAKSGSGEKRK